MSDFSAYQAVSRETAIYPEAGTGSVEELMYLALGLTGESGEIANKVKKLYRDGDSPEKRASIAGELGDVLWYLAGLCEALGIQLGDVALQNLDKLAARQLAGTLSGAGDNR